MGNEDKNPEWWRVLPAVEKDVIRSVLAAVRGLKRSGSRDYAQVAGKWERGISCFIKVRLMGEADRSGRAVKRGTLRVEVRR